MPAASTTGISTGVRIRIVGVMSIAVPTIITSTMIITISMMGLPRNGSSMPTTLPGRSATVMSHAETMAAATRNITIAVVVAACLEMPYGGDNLTRRQVTG